MQYQNITTQTNTNNSTPTFQSTPINMNNIKMVIPLPNNYDQDSITTSGLDLRHHSG